MGCIIFSLAKSLVKYYHSHDRYLVFEKLIIVMRYFMNLKAELKQRVTGERMAVRIVVMVLACTLMGLGISFYAHAAMGSDPCSTMNLGLAKVLGKNLGPVMVSTNIILLIFVVIFDRSMLGLGTIGNMVLCGFTSDFFNIFLDKLLPPTEEMSISFRVLLTLIGVVIQLFGISFYITADLGMAPYDCIPYIIEEKTHFNFRVVRVIWDWAFVAVGFFFGASVGIGTIIMCFCIGPIIPILNKHVAGPILKAENIRA